MSVISKVGATAGLALTLLTGPLAQAQQYIVIPPSERFEVYDSREFLGGVQGRPKQAEWTSSDPQIVELSYPIYLHYRAPAPGQPHISHVIRADCERVGRATVTAVPIDPNYVTVTVDVECVAPPPPKPEGGVIVPRNIEDCSGAAEGPTLKWTTPISDQNFPNCGNAAECAAVAGETICAAVNSFVSIRTDGKLCSECHHRNSGSTWSPDQNRNGMGGIALGDFAPRYADSFLTKSNPNSPAYKAAYLRALIQKWKDDGYR